MNSNTIAGLVGGTKRNNLLAITAIGTGQTILTMGTDSGSTTTSAFLAIPTQTNIQGTISPLGPNVNQALLDAGFTVPNYNALPNPPFNSSSFDGRPFRVRLSGGCVTSAGTNTATVAILQNTTAVLAGANTLASQVSGTLAAANFNFNMTVDCLWDSTSQKLVTTQSGVIAGTIVTASAATATGVTLPGTFIIAAITFGAGAANTVTPVEFSIEMV
jgi:hypothetical protein